MFSVWHIKDFQWINELAMKFMIEILKWLMNKWEDAKQLHSLRTIYKWINLIKYVQGLHAYNYKILIKEIKDLNKWRDTPWSLIGKLNIVKMLIVPRQFINRFNTVPIEIPTNILVDLNKHMLKYMLCS